MSLRTIRSKTTRPITGTRSSGHSLSCEPVTYLKRKRFSSQNCPVTYRSLNSPPRLRQQDFRSKVRRVARDRPIGFGRKSRSCAQLRSGLDGRADFDKSGVQAQREDLHPILTRRFYLIGEQLRREHHRLMEEGSGELMPIELADAHEKVLVRVPPAGRQRARLRDVAQNKVDCFPYPPVRVMHPQRLDVSSERRSRTRTLEIFRQSQFG